MSMYFLKLKLKYSNLLQAYKISENEIIFLKDVGQSDIKLHLPMPGMHFYF